MRVLDLFCGAGGAGMGYARLGWDVTGVDIVRQTNYPFRFIQADALTFDLSGYDFIHASPPCQAYSSLRSLWKDRVYPDLIPATRAILRKCGISSVIENVQRAPLYDPLLLCGSMFQLPIRRHRIFEFISCRRLSQPSCCHVGECISVHGHAVFSNREYYEASYTDGKGYTRRRPRSVPFSEGCSAMDIHWMARRELSQAIPPAYTEYIGRQYLLSITK